MPFTNLGLPFARDSHTSFKAAESVAVRRGEKMQRLLTAYRQAGSRGLTDQEASEATGLPVQSICSLRNAAADCELVVRDGERLGIYGKANSVWRLR